MIYLFETELPGGKSLLFALCRTYGLGRASSLFICKKLGFSGNLKTQNLSKDQITKLTKHVESLEIFLSSELLRIRLLVAKKLVSIKSYRGLRRYQGLPVRGQRTHTNAKTSRKKLK